MKQRRLEKKLGAGTTALKTTATSSVKSRRGKASYYPTTLQDFAELGMNVDGETTQSDEYVAYLCETGRAFT